MKLRNIILGAAAITGAIAMTSCSKDDNKDINLYQTWELKFDADELKDMSASGMYMAFDKDSASSYTKFTSESPAVSAFGLSTDTAYLVSKVKLVAATVNEDSAVAVVSYVSGSKTKEESTVIKKAANGYVMIAGGDTIDVAPVKKLVKTDRIRLSDLYGE